MQCQNSEASNSRVDDPLIPSHRFVALPVPPLYQTSHTPLSFHFIGEWLFSLFLSLSLSLATHFFPSNLLSATHRDSFDYLAWPCSCKDRNFTSGWYEVELPSIDSNPFAIEHMCACVSI